MYVGLLPARAPGVLVLLLMLLRRGLCHVLTATISILHPWQHVQHDLTVLGTQYSVSSSCGRCSPADGAVVGSVPTPAWSVAGHGPVRGCSGGRLRFRVHRWCALASVQTLPSCSAAVTSQNVSSQRSSSHNFAAS